MSSAPKNQEQSTLFEQTPTQANPGAAKPTDFIIEARDGGQRGDTNAERAALLAEGDIYKPTPRGGLLPDRNEVPHE